MALVLRGVPPFILQYCACILLFPLSRLFSFSLNWGIPRICGNSLIYFPFLNQVIEIMLLITGIHANNLLSKILDKLISTQLEVETGSIIDQGQHGFCSKSNKPPTIPTVFNWAYGFVSKCIIFIQTTQKPLTMLITLYY